MLEKKAPAGAHPGAQGLESPRFMYSRHKNEDSLFIKYRRCIFAGKKAPAGAHPGAQSLESQWFMYLRHKNQDYLFSKNRMSYFGKIEGFCYNLKSDFWLGVRRKRSKN